MDNDDFKGFKSLLDNLDVFVKAYTKSTKDQTRSNDELSGVINRYSANVSSGIKTIIELNYTAILKTATATNKVFYDSLERKFINQDKLTKSESKLKWLEEAQLGKRGDTGIMASIFGIQKLERKIEFEKYSEREKLLGSGKSEVELKKDFATLQSLLKDQAKVKSEVDRIRNKLGVTKEAFEASETGKVLVATLKNITSKISDVDSNIGISVDIAENIINAKAEANAEKDETSSIISKNKSIHENIVNPLKSELTDLTLEKTKYSSLPPSKLRTDKLKDTRSSIAIIREKIKAANLALNPNQQASNIEDIILSAIADIDEKYNLITPTNQHESHKNTDVIVSKIEEESKNVRVTIANKRLELAKLELAKINENIYNVEHGVAKVRSAPNPKNKGISSKASTLEPKKSEFSQHVNTGIVNVPNVAPTAVNPEEIAAKLQAALIEKKIKESISVSAINNETPFEYLGIDNIVTSAVNAMEDDSDNIVTSAVNAMEDDSDNVKYVDPKEDRRLQYNENRRKSRADAKIRQANVAPTAVNPEEIAAKLQAALIEKKIKESISVSAINNETPFEYLGIGNIVTSAVNAMEDDSDNVKYVDPKEDRRLQYNENRRKSRADAKIRQANVAPTAVNPEEIAAKLQAALIEKKIKESISVSAINNETPFEYLGIGNIVTSAVNAMEDDSDNVKYVDPKEDRRLQYNENRRKSRADAKIRQANVAPTAVNPEEIAAKLQAALIEKKIKESISVSAINNETPFEYLGIDNIVTSAVNAMEDDSDNIVTSAVNAMEDDSDNVKYVDPKEDRRLQYNENRRKSRADAKIRQANVAPTAVNPEEIAAKLQAALIEKKIKESISVSAINNETPFEYLGIGNIVTSAVNAMEDDSDNVKYVDPKEDRRLQYNENRRKSRADAKIRQANVIAQLKAKKDLADQAKASKKNKLVSKITEDSYDTQPKPEKAGRSKAESVGLSKVYVKKMALWDDSNDVDIAQGKIKNKLIDRIYEDTIVSDDLEVENKEEQDRKDEIQHEQLVDISETLHSIAESLHHNSMQVGAESHSDNSSHTSSIGTTIAESIAGATIVEGVKSMVGRVLLSARSIASTVMRLPFLRQVAAVSMAAGSTAGVMDAYSKYKKGGSISDVATAFTNGYKEYASFGMWKNDNISAINNTTADTLYNQKQNDNKSNSNEAVGDTTVIAPTVTNNNYTNKIQLPSRNTDPTTFNYFNSRHVNA